MTDNDDHETHGEMLSLKREPIDLYTVLLIIGVLAWLIASILIQERID